METLARKKHWETIFETKDTSKVSWYQPVPEYSLKLIGKLNLPESAKIIDVGAGDSFLGDNLLEMGYQEITLLDISEKALETIKKRLNEKQTSITFIASDILDFSTPQKYNAWHDRAVFHFFKEENDIQKYADIAYSHIVENGFLIIGTFSNSGPKECSNLEVTRYSEEKLTDAFNTKFKKVECFTENHTTPSGGIQNFLFCIFQRI